MAQSQRTLKLLKTGFVVLLLVGFSAFLLSTLSNARKTSIRKSLEVDSYSRGTWMDEGKTAPAPANGEKPAEPLNLAHVRTFVAQIDLIPGMSVGTAKPESIYEARFKAQITAINPGKSGGSCELQLPLPPKIISLADLKITINCEPSQDVMIQGDKLIWRGLLGSDKPVPIDITYTAVGTGIYKLEPPPGKIIETFETTLTAHQTNVRMMELSLQPAPPEHKDGNVIYKWTFANLMFGRPITLDVLGIAPVDQLGELSWLGPISVLVFGLLVSLLILAYRPAQLNTWMVLLVVGTFAGAYPLMYFAQEYMSLTAAAVASSVLVLLVIGVRAVTLFGRGIGMLGVGAMAAAMLALTLSAAIWPGFQGVLLTVGTIGVLVTSMIMLPKAQQNALETAPPQIPPPIPETKQP